MLNFILRRVVKFVLPAKIVLLAGGLGGLGYLIVYSSPDLGNIFLATLLLFTVLSLILSFFLTANPSLLAALCISFFLFLKAVGLLSLLNVGLFVIFLVLLGLYLRRK